MLLLENKQQRGDNFALLHPNKAIFKGLVLLLYHSLLLLLLLLLPLFFGYQETKPFFVHSAEIRFSFDVLQRPTSWHIEPVGMSVILRLSLSLFLCCLNASSL